MAFACGIVGLPNVGKSTIFNALTQSASAEAANYPFCTIDPNTGAVAVPDERLWVLKDIAKTNKVIPIQLEIVDIAGLVRGASKGAGKGNAFLNHIRGVSAIIHVVRCFHDDDIVHVDGSVDPLRDIETIDLELILKDLDSVSGKAERSRKRMNHDPEAKELVAVCDKLLAAFDQQRPARSLDLSDRERSLIADLQLLTMKPMLFVCNVSDSDLPNGNELSARVIAHAAELGAEAMVICGKIEEELAQLGADDRKAFMADLGLTEPGLNALVKAGYRILGLQTYFTAGEKEVRAWQIPIGARAPQAAAVIHTDFEAGFIRAEVCAYHDYVSNRGEKGCREVGRLRAEGKEYVVQDGDVVHFLVNS